MVGVFDDGIMAIRPSPDGELVVAITGTLGTGPQNLVLMTGDFDIISETLFFSQEESKGKTLFSLETRDTQTQNNNHLMIS